MTFTRTNRYRRLTRNLEPSPKAAGDALEIANLHRVLRAYGADKAKEFIVKQALSAMDLRPHHAPKAMPKNQMTRDGLIENITFFSAGVLVASRWPRHQAAIIRAGHAMHGIRDTIPDSRPDLERAIGYGSRPAKAGHIDSLDGLRGLAALWVLAGHATHAGQWTVPLLSRPDIAVDLFMMLSGFLMTHLYLLRRTREPWHDPGTWRRFWTRRFFRIAPAYYLVFAIALLVGDLAAEGPPSLDQVTNILLHVTFIFGMVPSYSYVTLAVPDWSIGLEMQFYVVFPFLFLLVAARGMLGAVLLAIATCLLLGFLLPGFLSSFPKPSFLPLRFAMFASGMLLAAAATRAPGPATRAMLALALLLPLVPLPELAWMRTIAAQMALVVALAGLVMPGRVPPFLRLDRLARAGAALLGSRPFRLLGDLSYGVYLVHLLPVFTAAGLLTALCGPGLPAPLQVGLILLLAAPPSYGIAWLLHRYVELPGIALGQRVLGNTPARLALPGTAIAGSPKRRRSR